MVVDGFKIPLPPGKWMNLAHSSLNGTFTGDAHFFAQVRAKRLVGAVRMFAARSKETPGAGFNEVLSCTEVNPGRNYVFIDGDMTPHAHQGCWTIRPAYVTPWQEWADRANKISSLDRAAAGDMSAKGVTYPQDFMTVLFTRTKPWGLLEVMYLFSLESRGIKSNVVVAVTETDWSPANIIGYPERAAYVEKLKSWGVAFWPKFKAAFDEGVQP